MKRILMGLFVWLFAINVFAQQNVVTIPGYHDWAKLYNETTGYLLVGAGGDGVDTSLAFCPRMFTGAITLALKSDTTGASVDAAQKSDSCLSIYIQFKSNNLGWGSYQNDNDTYKSLSGLSLVDTLDRALVNVAATNFRYFKLAGYDEWLWADSIRFIFSIGAVDSLKLYPEVGGQ